MKGKLVVHATNIKTGKRQLLVETENMVVNKMYEQLVKLLAGTAPLAYVFNMQFGTGTLAPAADQEFLQRAITPVKAVAAVPDPANYRVAFTAALLADEANGFPLSEAGLVCQDNVLVARALFDSRYKTADYLFDFTWTVTLKT